MQAGEDACGFFKGLNIYDTWVSQLSQRLPNLWADGLAIDTPSRGVMAGHGEHGC